MHLPGASVHLPGGETMENKGKEFSSYDFGRDIERTYVAELLLRHPISKEILTYQNGLGENVFMKACSSGHTETVKLLG